MPSKIEICNLALAHLGSNRINSLLDNTREAITLNTVYNTVASQVMSAADWSATRTRVALTPLSSEPAFGYTYEYQLPNDCLQVLAISTFVPDDSFTVEGSKLLTDQSTINLKYTRNLDTPENYGPHLTRAIIAKLTATIAQTLTGNINTAARAMAFYREEMEDALRLDRAQGDKESIVSQDLLANR